VPAERVKMNGRRQHIPAQQLTHSARIKQDA
jgi:hypothetical protein